MTAEQPVDILVVDDNPAKLLAIQTALAPLGQNLITATSGREALTRLLERDFATVILDVSMPDVDGFETARLIRSRDRSAHTPIIFVSAVNMDEIDARRGYSLGAVDYIFAPIVPEVLRAKVAVFVELYRKTEEARQQARQLEQSQRQLRLAERMASIGALCAGLGHDMGNLLLPIMARLDALGADELPSSAQENVESIRSCVDYLRKLCTGLRMLALDPEDTVLGEATELQSWWAENGLILQNALPRGVSLQFEPEAQLPPLRIARHALTQAVFNLVQNAGEALADAGGRVVIWARPEPAGGVRIGVTDNGPGMDPEVQAHCMDPYFTTKTRGISTGLGLALVHGIVQREGSELQVQSAPGEGSTFSFPIAAATESGPAPLAVVALAEPRARSVAAGLARSAGFEVAASLPAEDGPPAVWITDPAEGLEGAVASFIAGRDDRRVLVCAAGAGSAAEMLPPGASAFNLLDGGAPLRRELAAFARACPRTAGAAVPAPPAEGPAG